MPVILKVLSLLFLPFYSLYALENDNELEKILAREKKLLEAEFKNSENPTSTTLQPSTLPSTNNVASDSAISALEDEVNELRRDKVALQKELSTLRSNLLFAETEVERLAAVVATQNQCAIAKVTGRPLPKRGNPNQQLVRLKPRIDTIRQDPPPAPTPEAVLDVQIATVVVDKANLRSGAGSEHSPVMSVSKGTRLAVEVKEQSADGSLWYRVVTPTGGRAWVANEVVTLNEKNEEKKFPELDDAERRAFELLKSKEYERSSP